MRSAVFLSIRNKATRLPGKSLLPLRGMTTTEHLIERIKLASEPDVVVMTTSTHRDDAVLAEMAAKNGIRCYRGSEEDKLCRYLDAADAFGIEVFAVVDGDDILCEPACIDKVLGALQEGEVDYVICADMPVGATPFGVRTEALRHVCRIKAEGDTEVWGGYFTETGIFRSATIEVDPVLRRPDLRMTLDYDEDYAFFRAVFDHFYDENPAFRLEDVIRFLDDHPEVVALNRDVQVLYEEGIRVATPARLKRKTADTDSAQAGGS